MTLQRRHLHIAAALLACIAVAVGGIAWLVHRATYPPPAIIATLASPNRDFELIIVETQPQGFMMESPYLYDLSIMDRRGRVLGGEPCHIYNDSASLPASEFVAEWGDQRVNVRWSGRFQASAEFGNGAQLWR